MKQGALRMNPSEQCAGWEGIQWLDIQDSAWRRHIELLPLRLLRTA
jgi:hypothetical protein